MKRLTSVGIVALTSLLLGGWVGFRIIGQTAHANAQAPLERIPTPENWVALSSEFERIVEPGLIVKGRYYRGADGSRRHETGPSPGEITAISINNYTTLRHYRWTRRTGEWSSQPMQAPPQGLLKPANHVFTQARKPGAEKYEGFDTIHEEHGPELNIAAPALNMLVVRQIRRNCENTNAECGFRYFNIQLGPQPAHLFEPPADADVVNDPTPGGIVRKNRP